jgi:hypothetical protein
MLDIIASDLFKKYMPPITSMRLRCKQTPRLVQSFNDWNSMKDGPSDGPGASIGPDEGRQCWLDTRAGGQIPIPILSLKFYY